MNLKDIILKKIDSILNPKLENKVILTLLGLGALLIGVPSFLAFNAVLSIKNGNTSFTAEINNGADLLFVFIGLFCLISAVILFIKKQHRDDLVNAENSLENLHCQYFVCRNFEILKEISQLNLNRFPVKDPLLVKNHILSSLIDIINRHPNEYRHSTIHGHSFSNKEEYLKTYSHPDELVKDNKHYPYFRNTRKPSFEEIKEIGDQDCVVNAMIKSNFDNDIVVAGCYEDACAGIELQEEYLLRELWGIFLAVENTSDKPITLNSLEGEASQINGFDYFNMPSEKGSTKLPIVPIKPGNTVLIPVAVALPPIHPIPIERFSTKHETEISEHYQVLSECSINEDNLQDILVYGGIIRPNSIKYSKHGQTRTQPVHKIDLSNFYEIDMHWGCGSCPHLFFVNSKTSYVRELLASCQNQTGTDSFTIPNGIKKIIIAEIEDELTKIESILIDGEKYLSNLELKKGEIIEISVSCGQTIKVKGQYTPLISINSTIPSGRVRNTLIYEFLS